MSGLACILLGLASALLGWLLLRHSGPGWRIGRLLSAAPRRELTAAAAMATAGEKAYIRVHGRIDSAEEFPGIEGKPIVYRRRRLQQRGGRSGWKTFDDERLAVPFGLSERGQRIDIDTEALGEGLVVVPHQADGVASDVREEHAAGPLPDLPPNTPVRLRVDEISALEHATAAGVPRLDQNGSVVLGPGLGRPLVLTTLGHDEAMRVLAGERRTQLLLAAGLLVLALTLVLLGLALLVLAL